MQHTNFVGLNATQPDTAMKRHSPNGIHKAEGKSSTSDYETAPSEVRLVPLADLHVVQHLDQGRVTQGPTMRGHACRSHNLQSQLGLLHHTC